MRSLLIRKSVIALIIICLAGVLGTRFFSVSPSRTVGAPFARPIWWGGNLPATVVIDLDERGTVFVWDKKPPALWMLEGEVLANPDNGVEILWSTPSRTYTIKNLRGQELYWLNLDGRDMVFKQELGLPLIGNSAWHLLPEPGEYRLRIVGAESAELKLSLPGGKQGLLGTDQRGRDVFALLIFGVRTTLTVGICATLAASLLGLGFGLTAGYAGGLIDSLIMRMVDILLSIPILPILMVLAGVWGKGLWQLVLILSIFSWMGTARLVRALILTVRESPWVEGLRALGARRSYILWRHLVPEAAPILLANIALGVPGAILAEAGLAFLGLSDPRVISWGRMLHEAHSFGAFTQGAWWLLLPPGLGIVAMCLIFMDIGRYLEEKIDPRLMDGKKNA